MNAADDELVELRRRLADTEAALQAIRDGVADGIVDLGRAGGGDGASIITLASADRAYRLLIERMGEGAAALSSDGVVLYANPALAGVLGVTRDQLIGRRLATVVDDDTITPQVGRWEHRLQRPDGAVHDVLLSIVELDFDDGRAPLLGLTAVDLTSAHAAQQRVGALAEQVAELESTNVELEATEATLRHQATHDHLTGLPGRALLMERLGEALAGREPDETVAVLYCDLDRFKQVNDTYGHAAGDEVLVRVANRMRDAMRSFDTVARLSGDEFAIVARHLPDRATARVVAGRIVEAVGAAIRLGSSDSPATSVSVGVALAEVGDADAERLLHDADTAMYRSKELGRNRFVVYEAALGAKQRARERADALIRHALRNDGVRTRFQPVVDTTRGEVVAMEALVRLEDEAGELVYPSEFIAVAEETDLIIPLGTEVLLASCAQAAAWAEAGDHLPVHVNLSTRQVVPDLLEVVSGALRTTGLPPASLRLELTESALLSLDDSTSLVLRRLKAMGVGLGLDDFGTGYASLTALRRLPVDFIKIDHTFVIDVLDDEGAQAIVAAIVTLARSLDLEVIAEGVEDLRQIALLQGNGCSLAQGFLFAEALEPVAATRWLRARRRAG